MWAWADSELGEWMGGSIVGMVRMDVEGKGKKGVSLDHGEPTI